MYCTLIFVAVTCTFHFPKQSHVTYLNTFISNINTTVSSLFEVEHTFIKTGRRKNYAHDSF